MKEILVSALTTTLIIGLSEATCAESNPFSDVPSGHWAYQSVTTLANQGVIEGYGDGTYRGDRLITRYEMAQMIAKAIVHTERNHSAKADLDSLAVEFRAELNALGVRVVKLERYGDKVTWTGKIEYEYDNIRTASDKTGHKDKETIDGYFSFRARRRNK